jgi:hypothetical protein
LRYPLDVLVSEIIPGLEKAPSMNEQRVKQLIAAGMKGS